MTEYYIPAGPGEASFVEKRSEFLGHVRMVETEEDAKAFVAQVKKEHYDARHNCWCYAIKDGPVRYSDDGEPQGTAGVPMLEVFQRQNVTNFVCVVTRYFGGVLLGAGGLLRAYTKSAKDALDAAGIAVVRRWVEVRLPCSYSLLERLKKETEAMDGIVTDVEYGAGVTILALLPEENAPAYSARIFDVTSGTVTPEVTGETFRPVRIS
ncbi:MAG: YigZ family protein [Oscillospiraceae bacterium]|nr:YigZ family protein [Oscillospiraceae bacterium]MDD6502099.1 YigZ family protein [Oscillospiraceae bacterium]MDY4106017.1 YigZ family protein [Oscillospiraceae bacterium]